MNENLIFWFALATIAMLMEDKKTIEAEPNTFNEAWNSLNEKSKCKPHKAMKGNSRHNETAVIAKDFKEMYATQSEVL